MAGARARIRAVLFDLGGTLLDTRDFGGWAKIWTGLGIPTDAEELTNGWSAVHALPADPPTGRTELWTLALAHAVGRTIDPGLVARGLELRATQRLEGVAFSDVRRCTERLASDGRRLGIVSNSRSEAAVRDLLERNGLLSSFESVVSSGTEGVEKPAPEIYRRALTRFNLRPAEVLFVGDDVENDVRGPQLVGIHSVWLNRAGTGFSDGVPEINSLSEVPRVVRELDRSGLVK